MSTTVDTSSEAIAEAFAEGLTATVRFVVIAGMPESVSTVHVIGIDGDNLYYTSDGIWYSVANNASEFVSWTIDAVHESLSRTEATRLGKSGIDV